MNVVGALQLYGMLAMATNTSAVCMQLPALIHIAFLELS